MNTKHEVEEVSIPPRLLHGDYHYMTTLSRTFMVGENKHTMHKSLMIVTKTVFNSLDEMNAAVMKHIESGANLPFCIKRIVDDEGTKYVSGGSAIGDYPTRRWIRAKCSFEELRI